MILPLAMVWSKSGHQNERLFASFQVTVKTNYFSQRIIFNIWSSWQMNQGD